MSKKNIIICITLVILLLAGIIYGVSSLYSNGGKGSGSKGTPGSYPLLQAVPSDAALVMHFKSLDKALDIMTDTTMAFKGIGGAGKENFDKFLVKLSSERKSLGQIKSHNAAVAMLNSGNLVPLLIMDAGKASADSASTANGIIAMAKEEGLYSTISEGKLNCILVSTSETVVNSADRHIISGLSVLDSDGMRDIASSASGDNVIFVNCTYSGKLLTAHFPSKYNKHSDLFKKLGQWLVLSIDESSSKRVSISGYAGGKVTSNSFITFASNAQGGDVKVSEVLPSETFAFISIPTSDIKGFIDAREKYLDANGKLDKFKSSNQQIKKSTGMTASDWAKTIGLKEASIAWFHNGKNLESILLARTDSKKSSSEIEENPRPGIIPALFGDIFTIENDSHMTSYKGWEIYGSRNALEAYLAEGFLTNTVKTQMADCNLSGRIPSKNCNFILYWSAGNNPALIGEIFRKEAADAFKEVIKGVGFTPAVLSVTGGSHIQIDVDRLNITKSKAPIVERDTTVVIPQGPFEVKNSGTGETNLFYQNENLYLCLKETTGKGIWGVPFKEKICGKVESIDWYQNGKIQFLFGAGSKLYLIDRMGRFVNPFPVDLGKDILIGPAAYDFSGVGGYSAVVLHKDNSVEMYNLHGKKPDNWLGIRSDETIKALPELMQTGNKKYWIVRTSIQTLVFGFNGGDPLTKNEGDKMIRPDSKITLNDNGTITATCYDGKERNIKLDNKTK